MLSRNLVLAICLVACGGHEGDDSKGPSGSGKPKLARAKPLAEPEVE